MNISFLEKLKLKTIKAKMIGLFSILFLGFIILNGATFVQTNIISNNIDFLVEENLPLYQSIERIMHYEKIQENDILMVLMSGMFSEQFDDLEDTNQSDINPLEELRYLAPLIESEYRQAKTYIESYIKITSDIGLTEEVDKHLGIQRQLLDLEEEHLRTNDNLLRIIDDLGNNPDIETLMLGGSLVHDNLAKVVVDLEALKLDVNDVLLNNISEIHAVQTTANTVIMSVINVLFVLSILILIIVNRIAIRPLWSFKSCIEIIATGDFTSNISKQLTNREDEIGGVAKSLTLLKDNVLDLLKKVGRASQSVSKSSKTLVEVIEQYSSAMNEITDSMTQVADTSQEQTTEASLVVGKTNELSRRIEASKFQVSAVSEFSHLTNEMSVQGLRIIEELNEKTRRSNDSTVQIGGMTNDIHKSAVDAEQITHIIEAISSQTNLLALNASIEAARAGDAGKGFAVVAEEIRNLSEETSNATDNIKRLIGEIQGKSSKAVEMMLDIQTIFDDQNESINQTSSIFKETSNSLSSLSDKINLVEDITNDINTNKDQILESVKEIAKSIEFNSSSVQQVSASAQEQMASIEKLSMTAELSKKLSEDLMSSMCKFTI